MKLSDVQNYIGFIKAYSKKIIHRHQSGIDPEDLEQEILVRLLSSDSFDPDKLSKGGVNGWIYKNIYYIHLNLFKKTGSSVQVPLDFEVPIFQNAENSVFLSQILRAVDKISNPFQKAAIELHISGKYSIPESIYTRGCPNKDRIMGACPIIIGRHTHLYNARKELRQILGLPKRFRFM